MCFIVYGYSAYMTTVEPERNVWGYICVITFAIVAIMGISDFANSSKKNSENTDQNL
jgi:hypothetical protein